MYQRVKNGYLSKYPPVNVLTDAVIFTFPPPGMTKGGGVACLAYRRTEPDRPFVNQWALPGGYIRSEEDANDRAACERVLSQKLGFSPPYLEQLQTFSGAARDPDGWSLTVVYYALVRWELLADWWSEHGKTDRVKLVSMSEIHKRTVSLAFDHEEIIRTALNRLNTKARYSSLPCFLLPEWFSLKQMKEVYESLQDEPINMASFRRKVLALGFIEEIPGEFEYGPQRPAQLYRLKKNQPILFDRSL